MERGFSMLDKGMVFSEENWMGCLTALQFREEKDPNGHGYSVFDEDGIPMWQYETAEGKELLYYFLMGVEYQRMLNGVCGSGGCEI